MYVLKSFLLSCVGARSSIITRHRGLLFFEEIGFYMCVVKCVHRHGTSCFKSHSRKLGNIQSISYQRGLQKNEYREKESKPCLSTSTDPTHSPWQHLISFTKNQDKETDLLLLYKILHQSVGAQFCRF